jgi:hypothetical protein
MKFLILGLITLLLMVPGTVFAADNIAPIPLQSFKMTTNEIKHNSEFYPTFSSSKFSINLISEYFPDDTKSNRENWFFQTFEASWPREYKDIEILVVYSEYSDNLSFENSFGHAMKDYNQHTSYWKQKTLKDLPPYTICQTGVYGGEQLGICRIANYVVTFQTKNDLDHDFMIEDVLRNLVDTRYDKMKLQHEKLLKSTSIDGKKTLDIKNDLDAGNLYQRSDRNISHFPTVLLHEQDNFDLLEIQFDYKIEEVFNINTGIPFKTLLAIDIFSLDYDSWPKYSRIHSDDYLVLGTTIPGTTDWSVECPSYFGKVINPNIPYSVKACFEIPKNTNYFVFEGAVFSKAIVTTIEEINEVTKTDNTDLESEIIQSSVTVSETSEIVEHIAKQNPTNSGGGCLIATATYGSELAPQVQQLRELRDNSLLSTQSGTNFMNLFNGIYYSFSPVIADYERENPIFKEMVKIAITPMIANLSILNYVDMDSEIEVLGYGISLIILNGLMYVGIPVSVIVVIRKF